MRVPAVLLFIIMVVLSPSARACEPCLKILNLEETVKAAELIIVGRRTDYSPKEKERRKRQQGPDTIQVKVREVLKGNLKQGSRIKVNSWDGMCPYGILADEKVYVMLLIKRKRADNWTTVNNGCSQKSFPIEQGQVVLDGKSLSVADFAAKYIH